MKLLPSVVSHQLTPQLDSAEWDFALRHGWYCRSGPWMWRSVSYKGCQGSIVRRQNFDKLLSEHRGQWQWVRDVWICLFFVCKASKVRWQSAKIIRSKAYILYVKAMNQSANRWIQSLERLVWAMNQRANQSIHPSMHIKWARKEEF